MKYRILSIMLCLLTIFSLTAVPVYAAGEVAVKSNQPLYINSNNIEMTAYSIGGSNYVRLRDIAQAIDFDIYFDEFSGTIHILTNVPYTGEPSAIGQTPDTAQVTAAELKLFVDGYVQYITAYSIGGNNFVKLRDIGGLTDFSVNWDDANKRVLIETSKPNTPEVTQATEPTNSMTFDEMRAEIVRLTNIERVKAGLSELEVLPELMDCAQAKAQDFIDSHYFAHTSPVYGTAQEMIRAFVPKVGGGGENVASGQVTPSEAVGDWMNSPGHRANMLTGTYTHIGVGVSQGSNGRFFWVQQFVTLSR